MTKRKFNERQLKIYNEKLIDIMTLFLLLIKLKGYEYKFYLVIKDKFIELIKNNEIGVIKIKDLELTETELIKFIDWLNFFDRFENVNINDF